MIRKTEPISKKFILGIWELIMLSLCGAVAGSQKSGQTDTDGKKQLIGSLGDKIIMVSTHRSL